MQVSGFGLRVRGNGERPRVAGWAGLLGVLILTACGSQPPKPVAAPVPPASAASPAPTFGEKKTVVTKKGGGFYLDDGPLDHAIDLAAIPDAVPRAEPLHRFANRPYAVFGREYVPLTDASGYRQQGIASWYGRRYHGQKTSSGEPYDMFAMTAAHPTLPIPSYARVTRLDGGAESGKSVIVRINDRGPFLHDRLIDLSYAAAWKLGLVADGSGKVLVESVAPGENGGAPAPATSPAASPAAPDDPLKTLVTRAAAESLQTSNDGGGRGGHYLQLGAFASRENAEALKVKLQRELGDLADKLVVRSSGDLHRVQLGPWAEASEAQRIAEQLESRFQVTGFRVQ